MDKQQRNALIVLAVIALVVLGLVLWSIKRSAAEPQVGDPQKKAKDYSPTGIFATLGTAMSARGPKLVLSQTQFKVPAHSAMGPIIVPRAASASDKFRRGTFRLEIGTSAQIAYHDVTPNKGKSYEQFTDQVVKFPPDEAARRSGSGPPTGSIVAMLDGGTLTLSCADMTPCVFRLE